MNMTEPTTGHQCPAVPTFEAASLVREADQCCAFSPFNELENSIVIVPEASAIGLADIAASRTYQLAELLDLLSCSTDKIEACQFHTVVAPMVADLRQILHALQQRLHAQKPSPEGVRHD